jgi:hypothetical protein
LTKKNQGRPPTAIDTSAESLHIANAIVEARANSQTGTDEKERENNSLEEALHCAFVIEY